MYLKNTSRTLLLPASQGSIFPAGKNLLIPWSFAGKIEPLLGQTLKAR
jgi:hypothetical protein